MASQFPQTGTTLTGNVHEFRWNLPGPARPGYVQRLGRAVAFAGLLGVGVTATTALASLHTVYAAEINVVLARHLWPRAIVQPPLTEADRASMALQALQN